MTPLKAVEVPDAAGADDALLAAGEAAAKAAGLERRVGLKESPVFKKIYIYNTFILTLSYIYIIY